jgi:hypothetical protein
MEQRVLVDGASRGYSDWDLVCPYGLVSPKSFPGTAQSSKKYVKAQKKVGKAELIGGSIGEKGAEAFRRVISARGRIVAEALGRRRDFIYFPGRGSYSRRAGQEVTG